MKRGDHSYLSNVCVIVVILVLFFGTSKSFSQEIDPFYTNALEAAKKFFLAENYEEAIKRFKIAIFGLGNDDKLKATAHVFMSISYYYLNDITESERHLKNAEDLLNIEEIRNLEIVDTEMPLLEKLLIRFGIVKDIDTQLSELSRILRTQPDNISLYYDLYNLYVQKGDRGSAKKTLANLTKENPDEIDAYYMLGIINYQERNYKQAKKNFEKVLKPWEHISIGEILEEETKIYLILSNHHSGDKEKALKLVGESIKIFTPEKINSFPINDEDKITLTSIIARYWREKRQNQV
jgi:tetratricopeptide (TPR) repeat protein